MRGVWDFASLIWAISLILSSCNFGLKLFAGENAFFYRKILTHTLEKIDGVSKCSDNSSFVPILRDGVSQCSDNSRFVPILRDGVSQCSDNSRFVPILRDGVLSQRAETLDLSFSPVTMYFFIKNFSLTHTQAPIQLWVYVISSDFTQIFAADRVETWYVSHTWQNLQMGADRRATRRH